MVSNSGEIASPGVDTSGYPDMVQCEWEISAETGRALEMTFTQFDLEADKDTVEVRA